MRSHTKFIAVVTAILLLLPMITGCSPTAQPAAAPTAAPVSAATQSPEATAVVADVAPTAAPTTEPTLAPTTAPVSTEFQRKTDTLTILMDNTGSNDMSVDPTKLLIEKLTGYKLKIDTLPADLAQAKQKLELILASGESYDLIKVSSLALTKELMPKGYFLPLDDLLAKYGKDVTGNTMPGWFTPLRVDGKTYAIPIKRSSPADIMGTIYRKDIFDANGIAVPTTAAELKSALIKLKAATGQIPLTNPSGTTISETIGSAFGISNNYWYLVDGKLIPRPLMPGYKEYLKYMADLSAQGLLDKEIAANTDEVTQKKMASGKFAVSFWAWWWWPADAAIKQNQGAELAFMPPLKAEDGSSTAWLWGSAADWTTVIPKSAKYPEDAMNYLNLLSQNFETIFLGKEGDTYTKEGNIFVPTAKFTAEKKNAWMMLMVTNDAFRPKFEAISYAGEDKEVAQVFTSMQAAANGVAIEDPTTQLNAPEANGKYATALGALEKDFELAVMSGVKSPDEYDTFIAKWKQAGGDELVKAWNDTYAQSLSK